jgi:methylated-DNA-[protein]-cysteine S-methyltransferase
MNQSQYALKTKIGTLYLVASENGLRSLLFYQQKIPMVTTLNSQSKIEKHLKAAVAQVEQYLLGKRKTFDLKLDLAGTKFQQQVWNELVKIPFGQTLSYKDVAEKINNPKAVRAVGTANGRNPICIVVPCHRVIAANGTLGGYVAGLKVKKQLLDLENS